MIRILEIAWLVITLILGLVAGWQVYDEGIQSAIWMFIMAAIAFGMFMVRRKQRIRFDEQMHQQQQDEATRYH
ncbi:MAG: hypothetical protein NT126_06550 [Bacteroidetes bacterium]|nr:hypothetical protein [Bacteroidota bacterium]